MPLALLPGPGTVGPAAVAGVSHAATGVVKAVAGEGSGLGVAELAGLGPEGVVSISKCFGGVASGSSASRSCFLPLPPVGLLVTGLSLKGSIAYWWLQPLKS